MKTLYMMVGAPGSGKSYWIQKHIVKMAGYTAVESRDEVRFSLVKPEEEYFSKEDEVFRNWTNNIKLDLATPGIQNVIADATHISVASRRKLINALQKSLTDVRIVAIVMDTCEAKCIKQNKLRTGTRAYVPEKAIRDMSARFEMPNFNEDIDEIYIYRENNLTIKDKM